MANKDFALGNSIPSTRAIIELPDNVTINAPVLPDLMSKGPSFAQIASGSVNEKLTASIAMDSPRDIPDIALIPHDDSGKGEQVILDFQSNILDNYDTVTYHFKLFMVSTEVARNGDFLDPEKQTIVVESGVSDLTIDRVEMEAIAVPSVEAGTGTQTRMRFEIVEPVGAGLLDKMFYESVLLGIGNWFVMPCYLQLTFKGRTAESSAAGEDGQPGDLSALSWVWPIKLSNAKANVTTVGTRYEFEAIVYNELAQSNTYFAIQHGVVLNDIEYFGDAMKALEQKLNDDQFLKLINNYSQADTYKIIVDSKLARTKIIPTEDNDNSYRGGDFEILKNKTASFFSGTSIDKVVDALLANTEKYQSQMTDAQNQTAGANPGTINQSINKMKKFWRITTETRPIVFDYKRQNNALEITIFVFEYDLGANPASPTQTGGTSGTIEASKQQLDEYIRKKILKKKYNYIFTGLNDQVVSFDLNMNFSFAAALSRFGGVYYDSSSSDQGPVLQRNAEEETKITEMVRKVITMQNGASRDDNKADLPRLLKEANEAILASKLPDSEKIKLTTLLKTTKPEDRLALTRRAAQLKKEGIVGAAQGILPDNVAGAGRGVVNPPLVNGATLPDVQGASTNAIDDALNTEKQRAIAITTPINPKLKFISDLDLESREVKQAYQEFIATSKGKLRPIPFHEAMQESSVGQGKISNSDSGKNKLASLFSTALYSTVDASLLHIKMVIKGDPFWLFPQPVTGGKYNYLSKMPQDEAIAYIKSAHKEKSPKSVNFFGTDNFIIIRFRTPRIYNETANPDNPDPYTEVQAFTGVYRVLRLTNKFEMGKFTQELECQLDPVIDTQDLINRINEDVKKSDTKATAESLLQNGKLVPPTATGTSKLINGATSTIKDLRAQADSLKNQVKGVSDTIRNTAGEIKDLGTKTAGQLQASALSNIPPVPSFDLVAKAQTYIPAKLPLPPTSG